MYAFECKLQMFVIFTALNPNVMIGFRVYVDVVLFYDVGTSISMHSIYLRWNCNVIWCSSIDITLSLRLMKSFLAQTRLFSISYSFISHLNHVASSF